MLDQKIQAFACNFVFVKVNVFQIGELVAVLDQPLQAFICNFAASKVN